MTDHSVTGSGTTTSPRPAPTTHLPALDTARTYVAFLLVFEVITSIAGVLAVYFALASEPSPCLMICSVTFALMVGSFVAAHMNLHKARRAAHREGFHDPLPDVKRVAVRSYWALPVFWVGFQWIGAALEQFFA